MDPRYTLSIDSDGLVYLDDAETEDGRIIGHVERSSTWYDCPPSMRCELERLEDEWTERVRVDRLDRRCWEREYASSRGI